jgi:hypothetical protein
MAKARATIVVPDAEDEPPEAYHWVVDWLIRWKKDARIMGYSSEDLQHVWDMEGSHAAMAEIPPEIRRETEWSAKSGGKNKSRHAAGSMKFSVNKAKRLRNRARRASGEYKDDVEE